MKTIMLKKNKMKKVLIICCLIGGWYMNCVSTPPGSVKSNDQNLNSEFPGEVYFDKRQRFSVNIPQGWEIKYENDASDALVALVLVGLIIEYNVESSCVFIHKNTSLSISEWMDGAILGAEELRPLVEEPQRGNIDISTTDLQVDQRGNVDISTIDLKIEYIKILRYRENDGKILWQKSYYIPHRNGGSIVMITCSALLLPDDNVDLDIVFDKFVNTFNWIR